MNGFGFGKTKEKWTSVIKPPAPINAPISNILKSDGIKIKSRLAIGATLAI